MSKYKVIYRGDATNGGTTWEPGCPLYLSAVQVARNTTTSECYLQLKLVNVSDTTVESYKLEATIHYADGSTEAVIYEPLDADLPSHCVARPDPIALEGSQVSTVEASIKTISTGDKQWVSTGALLESDNKALVALSPRASRERETTLKKLGKDPGCYKYAALDHDAWWRCSCGTANVGQGTCVSCHLPKKEVFDLQEEDVLLRRAKQRKTRRTRTALISVTLVAIFFAALPLFLYFRTDIFVPNGSYEHALAQFRAGNYQESMKSFLALGTFRDSDALMRESALELGNQYFREGKFSEAEVRYAIASDKEAAAENKLRIADETLNEGKLAMAALMYENLGEEELAQETRYQYITNNFDGDYNQYLVDFLKQLVKDEYKDAADLLKSYQEKRKSDHPEVME